MFKNWKRTMRNGLLTALTAGGGIFSAPAAGCNAAEVKDLSSVQRQIVAPGPVRMLGDDRLFQY